MVSSWTPTMKHSQENRHLDQPLLLQRVHHPCLIPAQISICYSHLRKSCQMFGDQKVSKHWMGTAPNHTHRGRGTKCLYGFIVIHGWKKQGDTVHWTAWSLSTYISSVCMLRFVFTQKTTDLHDAFISAYLFHMLKMYPQGHWLWSRAPQTPLMCGSMWEHHGKVRWMSHQRVTLACRKSQGAHPHAVKLQQTEDTIFNYSLPRRLHVLYVLQTLPCWGNLISQ